MLRKAALASSVVASIPIVLPLMRSAVASTWSIHVKTARYVSRSIRRRVREMVECSGGASSRPSPKNPRSARESAVRHDAALRIDPLEITDQQQAEVRARRQTRAADRSGVERRTLRFDERVEGVRVEHLIQSLIERMAASGGQLIRRNPQPRRACPVRTSAHSHAGV